MLHCNFPTREDNWIEQYILSKRAYSRYVYLYFVYMYICMWGVVCALLSHISQAYADILAYWWKHRPLTSVLYHNKRHAACWLRVTYIVLIIMPDNWSWMHTHTPIFVSIYTCCSHVHIVTDANLQQETVHNLCCERYTEGSEGLRCVRSLGKGRL